MTTRENKSDGFLHLELAMHLLGGGWGVREGKERDTDSSCNCLNIYKSEGKITGIK